MGTTIKSLTDATTCSSNASGLKIAIFGRQGYTMNYEKYVKSISAFPLPTLSLGELSSCDALILPGGGDITPAFFGELNAGSRNIDTELDILQFQALDFCLRRNKPILGICKGMQVINVAFGGTITQDMPDSSRHRYTEQDQYHDTTIQENSCLFQLYGRQLLVNSAHHQCINRLGTDLDAIQWCTQDGCVEGIVHKNLPILGLQWHPERLATIQSSGAPVLNLFASWIAAFSAPSL